MRIALIGPPFIEIPPRRYGGTELFIGNLARDLFRRGEEVVVYGNGDSSLPCPVKWRYPHGDWPCDSSVRAQLKNADHTAWAVRDALEFADVIHLNDIVGLPFTMFTEVPTVLTIHHPHEPELSEQYLRYPETLYVAIARWLRRSEPMPRRPRRASRHSRLRLHVVGRERRLRRISRADGAVQGPAPGHRGGAACGSPAEARRRDPAVFQRLLGAAGPPARRRRSDRIRRRSGLCGEERAALAGAGAAVSDSMGRAVRARDGRGDGLRHAGPRVCRRLRRGGRGRRCERLDLPGCRRDGAADRVARCRGVLVPDVRRRSLFRREDDGAIPRRLSMRVRDGSDPPRDWRPEWKT